MGEEFLKLFEEYDSSPSYGLDPKTVKAREAVTVYVEGLESTNARLVEENQSLSRWIAEHAAVVIENKWTGRTEWCIACGGRAPLKDGASTLVHAIDCKRMELRASLQPHTGETHG